MLTAHAAKGMGPQNTPFNHQLGRHTIAFKEAAYRNKWKVVEAFLEHGLSPSCATSRAAFEDVLSAQSCIKGGAVARQLALQRSY